MQHPPVYWILGIPGSEKQKVLQDFTENGFAPETAYQVLTPASEPEMEFVARGGMRGPVEPVPYTDADLEEGSATPKLKLGTQTFILFDGTHNPVDQIEAWKTWCTLRQLKLARVITLVDCRFLSENEGATAWFDACIHFSDAVLLANRRDVSNRWLEDFQQRYKKQKFPCIIDLVKKGGLDNPAFILEPEPRRMSLALDEWEEDYSTSNEYQGIPIEDEGDPIDPDDVDDPIPEDPYLTRMPGGRRLKKLPDIREFLPS